MLLWACDASRSRLGGRPSTSAGSVSVIEKALVASSTWLEKSVVSLRQLLRDRVEPLSLLARQADAGQLGVENLVVDDAPLRFGQGRPGGPLLQPFERPINRLALTDAQAERDDLGQHLFVGLAQLGRVEHAQQMRNGTPRVLKRSIQFVERFDGAGPGRLDVLFDLARIGPTRRPELCARPGTMCSGLMRSNRGKPSVTSNGLSARSDVDTSDSSL